MDESQLDHVKLPKQAWIDGRISEVISQHESKVGTTYSALLGCGLATAGPGRVRNCEGWYGYDGA